VRDNFILVGIFLLVFLNQAILLCRTGNALLQFSATALGLRLWFLEEVVVLEGDLVERIFDPGAVLAGFQCVVFGFGDEVRAISSAAFEFLAFEVLLDFLEVVTTP
jgi:hypothetical protein